jgi:hypothetical protein
MTKTDRPQVAHEACLRAWERGEEVPTAQDISFYRAQMCCEVCLRPMAQRSPMAPEPTTIGDPTADALIEAGRRETARISRGQEEASAVYRGVAERGAAADADRSDTLLVSAAEMVIWKKLHEEDRLTLTAKRQKYGDSWKRRGGTGAFHVGIRMADRLDAIAQQHGYDIFAAMDADVPGQEGMLNAIGDLRRYLLLWEGEHRLRQQPLQELIGGSVGDRVTERMRRRDRD